MIITHQIMQRKDPGGFNNELDSKSNANRQTLNLMGRREI